MKQCGRWPVLGPVGTADLFCLLAAAAMVLAPWGLRLVAPHQEARGVEAQNDAAHQTGNKAGPWSWAIVVPGVIALVQTGVIWRQARIADEQRKLTAAQNAVAERQANISDRQHRVAVAQAEMARLDMAARLRPRLVVRDCLATLTSERRIRVEFAVCNVGSSTAITKSVVVAFQIEDTLHQPGRLPTVIMRRKKIRQLTLPPGDVKKPFVCFDDMADVYECHPATTECHLFGTIDYVSDMGPARYTMGFRRRQKHMTEGSGWERSTDEEQEYSY